MRGLLLAAAALALGACVPSLPESPGSVANQTRLDEQARIAAGLAYVTASTLGNRLSRAGLIDRQRFQALDAAAFSALQRVREAYAAGNAASYTAALAQLHSLISGINALAGN